MGVVFEAEQLSLHRRVALKVLPLVGLLDERQLHRFQNEARAAAQLDHPHIVDIFSVGCERGVHYYAMQFIEGITLAAVIDHLRAQKRPPPEIGVGAEDTVPQADTTLAATAELARLSTQHATQAPDDFRSVARPGVQAAEALDHAHQNGVLHRDVKPGNLMLDARGNVWITDFGLARIDAQAGLTRTGTSSARPAT